jgi:uridine kinase
MVIGIAGGSGSGKTTFAKKLLLVIGEERAVVLQQDSYYKDQKDAFIKDPLAVNFDHPDVIDFELLTEDLKKLKAGMSIDVPQYDFVTHSRKQETTHLVPKAVVIVEGILIFHYLKLFKEFDLSFFMDAPEALRLKRRTERDARERGRTPASTREQFMRQVKPMHDLYVEPSKSLANYVVNTY